jgi:hypothetical protein
MPFVSFRCIHSAPPPPDQRFWLRLARLCTRLDFVYFTLPFVFVYAWTQSRTSYSFAPCVRGIRLALALPLTNPSHPTMPFVTLRCVLSAAFLSLRRLVEQLFSLPFPSILFPSLLLSHNISRSAPHGEYLTSRSPFLFAWNLWSCDLYQVESSCMIVSAVACSWKMDRSYSYKLESNIITSVPPLQSPHSYPSHMYPSLLCHSSHFHPSLHLVSGFRLTSPLHTPRIPSSPARSSLLEIRLPYLSKVRCMYTILCPFHPFIPFIECSVL